jgi:uncharacterized glyoxalase superfamily protein PhnB
MQMNPYLSFKGDCEAAFKFYERCLGGQVRRGAPKEGGELATVEQVITSGARAEVAEHEILSHAVMKLSHEDLLVKEKGSPGSQARPHGESVPGTLERGNQFRGPDPQ